VEERAALAGIAVVSVTAVAVVGALLLGGPSHPSAGGQSSLPAVNALLNGCSAVLLALGYFFVRRRRFRAHRACMVLAFGVSMLFLVSYLAYHYTSGSRSFSGTGWTRWVYFPLLISHIALAAAIVPLALVTIYRAARGEFIRHRRVARWTFPLWLYVSVTGVLVYWMLYRLGA
jgi:putative membrane protein